MANRTEPRAFRPGAILARLLAFALIAESMFGALRVANLISRLGGYDAIAVTLIIARALVCPLQFVSGWLLANRRPQGFALAPWAFLIAAGLTVFDVGLGLAPTSVYPWLRWHVAIGYAIYATAAAFFIRKTNN